ncbi:MAG: [FeFe] hydrogenase H-cluster radical SAM maturase HydG [Polyangiaceae bacterium]|nr:[FeFe] hydrogenase H-cluster radical SAM maturase HydG [Polyangiaceae bacterium]
MSNQLSRHAIDFVDDEAIRDLLETRRLADVHAVRDIVAKSLEKVPLDVAEAAVLLHARTPELREEVFTAARQLKEQVYGNRIVLFAPLYVGNRCVNHCTYCGFRRENTEQLRRTLSTRELREQVVALERQGHKRLIVVFGEHPTYDAEFMASCIRNIYDVHAGHGEIRRVNVNAAPLDHAGFRTVKAAGIGTYQIFMETYDHRVYGDAHPRGPKSDYLWRLDGLSRAFEVGQDDIGIGALFGLADWRFDVLGLVSHAVFLKERYGCGPHTISFPRLRPASGSALDGRPLVSDDDLKLLVAVLRLAVPYTGLILTAREPADLRRELLAFGVSQIDAGSRIEIGGYTECGDAQQMNAEQFQLGDVRSLDEVILELSETGYVPSFCTACYRLGRTGEHFMEFAIPGFIKRFCTPNALSTFQEYLSDYASAATRAAGETQIEAELQALPEGALKERLVSRLHAIQTTDERDLYF